MKTDPDLLSLPGLNELRTEYVSKYGHMCNVSLELTNKLIRNTRSVKANCDRQLKCLVGIKVTKILELEMGSRSGNTYQTLPKIKLAWPEC